MNKKQEIALLGSIVDFSNSIFNFIGKQKAQDWAIKVANEGYNREKFSKEEEFYYSCFRLSQTCYKIKYIREESDGLFHVQQSESI